ncbi:MAG: FeoA family protein [Clostridiaceae bacterium]|nr:FeoA family protein [Clostridiaceae bacterium]
MINNIGSIDKKPLTSIPLGVKCRVIALKAEGAIRRRILDLGLINGTEVIGLSKSPSGDPTAYLIRGAVIALRSEDASKIIVEII